MLTTLSQLLLFLGSLSLVLISGWVLGVTVDRIGQRLRFSEGLMGLLTALASDTPEIASAVSALLAGQHDVGVGVVFGSCVFNLAGLLGLSALVAGRIRIGRHGLLLDGAAALLVTIISAALVSGLLSPWSAIALVAAVVIPYVLAFSLRAEQVRRIPLPRAVHRFLDRAVEHVQHDTRKDKTPPRATSTEFLAVIPMLASVAFGSFWMVDSAVALSVHWHVPTAIVGTLILSVLTSLPNVITAVRLALHGRGAAVISETFNSNTLNILSGTCIPALFFAGMFSHSSEGLFTVWWLLGMTVGALIITSVRGGLHRAGGVLILLAYAVFALRVILRS